jgi:hypothetical protein
LGGAAFGKAGLAGSVATAFVARRGAAGFDGAALPDLVFEFVMIYK